MQIIAFNSDKVKRFNSKVSDFHRKVENYLNFTSKLQLY